MHPTTTRPRPSRRSLLIVVTIALIATVPGIALANHFTDVDPGNVHAPGIEYLADAGITTGCTPTTFCPNDDVTRAQMATFLFRNSGNDPATPPNVTAAAVDGIELVTNEQTVAAGSTANPVTVACPAGKVAVGGGGTAAIGWVLKDSNPLAGLGGWRAQHRTFDGQPAPAQGTSTVYAICVPAG